MRSTGTSTGEPAAAPAAESTPEAPKAKTLEERVADLEKRLEPIIGPPGE